MDLKLIETDPKQKDFSQVDALYQQAFPADELYPAELLRAHLNDKNAKFWSIYDQAKWIGFTYCMTEKDLTYVGFLAISPEFRGTGYGSQTLKLIKEKYANNRVCLLIEEVERSYSDFEARKKRLSFYRKNGFQLAGFKIVELGVTYDFLVAVGQSLRSSEYLTLINNYTGPIYAKIVNSHTVK
ncbi:GNAT family acetyltransferase [Ligilactobacillus salitolerans]|uniref:GNAT family acetyltransferase n=1 Tax=Ligilactobacillus salitolerans TaxID=1808352 RepID=A0A401IRN5_9LACO|nr:GNAT family N-acetyltransferase [Ligilactobacillus salitolerans]GBG94164.1 GNAT family acetyltransferase [Ligilactobacillus salitolerans]